MKRTSQIRYLKIKNGKCATPNGDRSFRLGVVSLTSYVVPLKSETSLLSAMIQKSAIRMYIPRSFKHWSQAKAVRELTQQVSRTTSEVSEQDVGETTVNPWASLFPSQCLSCVLFCFLWRQRGLSGGRRADSFSMPRFWFNTCFKWSITYYNFLQTSNWVCHHHLLSLVITVFTCLGSSLFLDVKILL